MISNIIFNVLLYLKGDNTMKCLIINGSPRKGFTWKLVESIKQKMQQAGNVEFEEVMLMDSNIPMCRGWLG